MFANALKYELKQSLRLFVMLSGLTLALALIARIGVFSLTDMPLFYTAFFGSVGVIVYRFHRTMFGQEAVFMFSIVLSASAQIMLRLCAALILSLCSAAVLGASLVIQGEAMSALMLGLPSGIRLVLFGEVFLSEFFLSVIIAAVLTLANLPFCRNERTIWMVIWAIVIFGAIALLSALTKGVADFYLIIQAGAGVFISEVAEMPSSFAFSVNTLLWQALLLPALVGLMCRLTRRYQVLA